MWEYTMETDKPKKRSLSMQTAKMQLILKISHFIAIVNSVF